MSESFLIGLTRKRGSACGALSVAVLACASLVLANPPALAGITWHGPRAHFARTVSGNVSAHLHLVKASGSRLLEEGTASGGLPGRIRADLDVGATFTGTLTVYTSRGAVTGHGTAVPHGSGRYESFSGTFTITGGTHRYAHAHGKAELFGTFDRRTYALVVQTHGKLTY